MRGLTPAAAVAALAVAVLAPAAGGRAGNTATFADPAGDAGSAPDVTALTIGDSAGLWQFALTVDAMPANSGVFVFMDTDRNAATGSTSGSEYEVEMTVGLDGRRWYDVLRWANGDWTAVAQSAAMGMSVGGATWTVRVGSADIGSPGPFTFWVATGLWDANDKLVAADRLPDSGTLLYEPTAPTPPPTTTTTPAPKPAAIVPWIGRPTITPAAKAGARVSVTFPVTDRAAGTPLRSGKMTCDPQVAGTVLAHSESFGNGTATLRFTIPKSARGKVLRVNLTIRVGAKSAHTTATFRVR